jgi:hypothetical protein
MLNGIRTRAERYAAEPQRETSWPCRTGRA